MYTKINFFLYTWIMKLKKIVVVCDKYNVAGIGIIAWTLYRYAMNISRLFLLNKILCK